MIDVKQAVEGAYRTLVQLLGEHELAGVDPKEITLEEFDLSEDSKFWNITLGYPDLEAVAAGAATGASERSVARFLERVPRRRFRVFKVDAESGGVHSMKIP